MFGIKFVFYNSVFVIFVLEVTISISVTRQPSITSASASINGRPLYMDAQATTPMVCLEFFFIVFILRIYFC